MEKMAYLNDDELYEYMALGIDYKIRRLYWLISSLSDRDFSQNYPKNSEEKQAYLEKQATFGRLLDSSISELEKVETYGISEFTVGE